MNTLRNILSKSQLLQLNDFINLSQKYNERFSIIEPDLYSQLKDTFKFPIKSYCDFLSNVLEEYSNGEYILFFCHKNDEEIQEIIFDNRFESIYDVLPNLNCIPLLNFEANSIRDLLNFIEIESDKEIAINKAKFLEDIMKDEPLEVA